MAEGDLERITILLQAKDRDFARAMDRNNKLIAKMSRDASRNTNAMTRQIDMNLSSLSKTVATFGATFAKGLAVGAVTTATAMITTNIGATVKSIAALGDEAKRSGLGIEAFQEWKFVAEQNRISVDSLVDGFKELSLRADEFIATGAGSAAEAFKRLGLSGAELKRRLKDPSELMLEIMSRLEGLDKAAQIRIADEVFGGTGGERFVELLSHGEAGLRSMIATAHEAGAVLDAEMIAKADEIDKKWEALKTKTGSWLKLLAVSLADIPFDAFDTRINEIFGSEAQARSILGDKAFEDLRSAVALTEQQADAANNLRSVYQGVSEDARQLSIELAGAAEMADMLGNDALWEALATASTDMRNLADQFAAGTISGEEFGVAMEAVRSRAADALDQLSDIDKAQFGGVIASLGGLWGALNGLVLKAAELKSALPGNGAGGFAPDLSRFPSPTAVDVQTPGADTPRPQSRPSSWNGEVITPETFAEMFGSKGGKGGGKSKDRFAENLASLKEETAALIAEAQVLNDAALGFDEYGIAQDVARRKAELLQAAQNEGKTITPELAAEIDALAASYAEAAQRAEEARERHEEFQSALDDMKGTMGDAFEGLITGAMSFKEAIASIISKLASMAAQRAFEALWSGGLGSATGGLISGLFGFASGGYTGPGGRNEVAGVAHKGEVIFSQDDVRRAGGVAAVEAARRSGMASVAAPAAAASAQAQPQPVVVHVQASPYFDARVSQVSSVGDAQVAMAQQRAMPGAIRDMQARGTR